MHTASYIQHLKHDSGVWNKVASNILQYLMTILNKLLETIYHFEQYCANVD